MSAALSTFVYMWPQPWQSWGHPLAAMCHTISHKYSAHLRTRKISSAVNPHCKFSPGHRKPGSCVTCVTMSQASWGHLTPESRGDCRNNLPLSLNLENDFFDPAPDSVGLRHLWRDVVEPFTAFVAYRCQLLMEWVRAESAHQLDSSHWAKYNLYSVNHADYFSYSSSTFQLFPTENVPNYQNFADESKISTQVESKYVNLKILMSYERNKNIGHPN